jgi:hypothetical protein
MIRDKKLTIIKDLMQIFSLDNPDLSEVDYGNYFDELYELDTAKLQQRYNRHLVADMMRKRKEKLKRV